MTYGHQERVETMCDPRAFLTIVLTLSISCATGGVHQDTRSAIEAQIRKGVEATRDKDIETYMSIVPADWRVVGEDGHVIGREQLRADVVRDWSIIVKTLTIDVQVERLEVQGDSATVYTRQRWERLMLERDGKTKDTILTTQRHKELWRRTPSSWMAYEISELGGEVYVNGRPFNPNK